MPIPLLESLKLSEAERRLIEAALSEATSLAGAAALLGVTRHTLKRRMVKYGLCHLKP